MGNKLVTAVDHHNQSILHIQTLQTCTKQHLDSTKKMSKGPVTLL